jgi:D-alanyl-D-alanine carboxypeptidase (penicillin-binding protein 5/6)
VHNRPAVIEAPVATGQPLGEIKVSLNDELLLQEQLRALADNPSGSLWQRAVDTVMLWLE